MPNVKYRCQKSYVVLMSDGDANLSCGLDNTGYKWPKSDFKYGDLSRYSDYYRRNISLEEPKYREAYNYFGYRQAGSCQKRELGHMIPLGI